MVASAAAADDTSHVRDSFIHLSHAPNSQPHATERSTTPRVAHASVLLPSQPPPRVVAPLRATCRPRLRHPCAIGQLSSGEDDEDCDSNDGEERFAFDDAKAG